MRCKLCLCALLPALLYLLQVLTLDPAEASRLLSGKPAAAGPADGQQQQQAQPPEPYVQVQITVNADPASEAPIKVTLKLLHPLAAAAAAKKAAAAAAAAAAGGGTAVRGSTTSSVSRLPGSRRQFGAGLGTRPGAAAAAASGGVSEGGSSGSSISALLGGAWATPGGSSAAAAGGGCDGGEPASKKARKKPQKRVAWRAEHDLVAVRWFIKDDPPAQVREVDGG
jgi:hypothetical protein